MKVIFFETSEKDAAHLKELLPHGLEIEFCEDPLTEDNAKKAEGAQAISIFVNSQVNKKVISKLPSLELITTRSTGFDHIDTKAAKKAGVEIANVPTYGSRTVAEYTFGLILNVARQIYEAYHQLQEKGSLDISGLEGFDLYNKTLGVIGTGDIGSNVIKIAKGFDMNVLAYDIEPDKAFSAEYDFHYKNLNQVLKGSDIITLHVPYNKHTHHLINEENIFECKKGAYLINTSRGAVVETNVLLKALQEKHLAGAGLDVLEGEKALKEEMDIALSPESHADQFQTLVADHILINLPNVIVTPHIAFFSKGAKKRILKTTAENIKNFAGGEPSNIVN